MSSKKKWAIALITTIGILLIVSVALIAIFGAANQNITSKIQVSYKKKPGVEGNVSATYSYGNIYRDMTTDGKEADNDNKHIHFSASESSKTQTLQLQSSDLKNGALMLSNAEELVLAFKFENTGHSDFTAYLVVEDTKSNIKLSYSDKNGNWSTKPLEIFVESPLKNPQNSERICYIKIEVENSAKDAEFEGTFIWYLESEALNS